MRASASAYNLTKRFEDEAGFLSGKCTRLLPYRCPAGKWTAGWGHTGPDVRPDTQITPERAEEWLALDMATAEQIVNLHVSAPLNQSQFDALCDFVFNVGPGVPGHKDGFVWLKARSASGQPRHSTLLRKLNNGDYAGAADEFPKWAKARSVVMSGLVKRRAAERKLFLS